MSPILNPWLIGGMVILVAGLLSYLLFRPVARAFAGGELNNRVAVLFFVHAIGGAGMMLASFLIAKSLATRPEIPVIASAVGWTAPSLAIAWRTWQTLRSKSNGKEE